MGFSKAEEISPLPANLCLFICSSNMSLLVLWHGNCTASKRKVGGGQHGERGREREFRWASKSSNPDKYPFMILPADRLILILSSHTRSK